MKNLELNEMEKIHGEGWGSSFWSGACGGVALMSLAFLAGAVSMGAGAGVVLGAASAVCYLSDR